MHKLLRNAYIFRFHRCLYETWQPGTSQHLSTALKNLATEYHPFEVESIMGKRERVALVIVRRLMPIVSAWKAFVRL